MALQLTLMISHQLPLLLWLNPQTQTILSSSVDLMNDLLAWILQQILSYWTILRTHLLNPWPPPLLCLFHPFLSLLPLLLCHMSSSTQHHCNCPCTHYHLANPWLIILSVLPAMLCCYSSIMMSPTSFVLAVGCSPMLFSPLIAACQYHLSFFKIAQPTLFSLSLSLHSSSICLL